MIYQSQVVAQSGACDPQTPFEQANLASDPDSTWISSSINRSGTCCGNLGIPPVRCVEFQVSLHPGAVGLIFDIASGTIPSGTNTYQVNCGTDVVLGDTVCLTGTGPFIVTFCKAGNSINTFSIQSITTEVSVTDVDVRAGCEAQLTAMGFVETTVFWSDITSGVGTYDAYLDCTSGCLTTTVTPDDAAPSFIDYQICGLVESNSCSGVVTFMCDTARVNISPSFEITNTESNVYFCSTDDPKLIEVETSQSSYTYQYEWNGAPPTYDNSLAISTPGNYTVIVMDENWPDCSRDTMTFVVQFSDPVAEINATSTSCPDETVEFVASDAGDDDAVYSWNFGPGSTPYTAIGQGPHDVDYADCSDRTILLEVFVDGCVTRDTLQMMRPDTVPPTLTNVPDDVVIECQDCIQAFLNGDMENVAPFSGEWTYMNDSFIDGWETTASDNIIEIWRDGFSGVPAFDGEFFAELNGTQASDFFQEFCTVPTTTLQISFAHRKRVDSNNTTDDILGVYIGPDMANLTRVGSAVATNTSGWTVHTVSYLVPAGQTSTVFLFRADQGAPGNLTFGNLIDAVNVVTLFDVVVVPDATDDCDTDVELELAERRIDGGCGENYRLVRSWTARDDCGNVARDSQVLVVGDLDAPEFVNPPADTAVECYNIPLSPITLVTDNCAADIDTNLNITITPITDCNYIVTRTWTATDSCGNSATHTQRITVNDTSPPELLNVPADQTVECSAIPTGLGVTATDACNSVVDLNMMEMIDSLDGCWVRITRVWSAEDNCGNDTTATQVITVEDNTAPIFDNLPANTTISCGSSVPSGLGVTATDNCDRSVDVTMVETTCEDYYPYYADDGSGNITYLFEAEDPNVTSYPVTVDNLNVTAVCSPDPSVVKRWEINNPNGIAVYVSWELIGTTQAGGYWAPPGLSYFFSETDAGSNSVIVRWTRHNGAARSRNRTANNTQCNLNNELSCICRIVRDYTAQDDCGNITTGTQQLLQINSGTPTFVNLPSDVTVLSCDLIPDTPSVSLSNACPGTVLSFVETQLGSGCTYSITRSWIATDDCGNQYIEEQLIIIDDQTPPTFSGVPADATIGCGTSWPTLTSTPTAADCNGVQSLTFQETEVDDPCYSRLERVWTATDNCGNISTTQQIIYQEDTEGPVFTLTDTASINQAIRDSILLAASDTLTSLDTCSCYSENNYLHREYWLDITGSNISDLTGNANYPNNPSGISQLTSFTTAFNFGDNYGTRVRGFIVPDVSGVYEFNVMGDNQTYLYLSPTCDPDSMSLIAQVQDFTYTPDKYPEMTSSPISLEAGRPYYVELLHKEGDSGDYFTVSWRNTSVGATAWDVIGSSNLRALDCISNPPSDLRYCIGTNGELRREVWTGISSSNLTNLVSFSDYPNNPNTVDVINTFQGPRNVGESYGTRVRGFIQAPTTGKYIFNITGDDDVQLFLSGGRDTASLSMIAEIDGWTRTTEHTKYTSQTSDSIFLQAGQYYFVELLHKEGGGGDHYTVHWRTPTATTSDWVVIGSSFIYNYQLCDTSNLVPINPLDTLNIPECLEPPAMPVVTVTDNCTPDSALNIIFTETEVGDSCDYTISRIWSVTDDCGNITTASQITRIRDSLPPVIIGVPADITVYCLDIPPPPDISGILAFDNCDTNIMVTYAEVSNQTSNNTCSDLNYTVERSWTAEDNCGNVRVERQTVYMFCECCGNGIDDDEDGLIDGNDPECPCVTSSANIECDTLVEYYVPPIWQTGRNSTSTPSELILSTSFPTASVRVYTIDGSFDNTYTVVGGTPTVIPLTVDQLQTPNANTVESNRGFIIESNRLLQVLYRLDAQYSKMLMTVKGGQALGETFYAGSQTNVCTGQYSSGENHFISVMAVEDSTAVNFEFDIDMFGITGSRHNVLLNAGETYLIRDNDNNQTVSGSLIHADKPIAVVSGSQHNAVCGVGGRDAGVDQLVPTCLLGSDYGLVRGFGPAYQNYAIVVAVENDTEVYLNGNPTPVASSLFAGDFIEVPLPGGEGDPNFIRGSKPIYVYHVSGISQTNSEVGMAIAAPVGNCRGDTYVEFSRFNNGRHGAYVIIPNSGLTSLTLNGNPYTDYGSAISVPGLSGYSSVHFVDSVVQTNNVLRSDDFFQAGILVGINGASGTHGYLTSFKDKINFIDPDLNIPTASYFVDTICETNSLIHCLEVESCANFHQITDIIPGDHTGSVRQTSDLCFEYTATTDYSGPDRITVIVQSEFGLEQAVCLDLYVCSGEPVFTFTPNDTLIDACSLFSPDTIYPIATHDCGVQIDFEVNENLQQVGCPGRLELIRTFTASDRCGNMTTTSQLIIIQDDSAPV
ncbi:MAG: PA14 domain-containing protein, partial [Bacteroidota bacterium]